MRIRTIRLVGGTLCNQAKPRYWFKKRQDNSACGAPWEVGEGGGYVPPSEPASTNQALLQRIRLCTPMAATGAPTGGAGTTAHHRALSIGTRHGQHAPKRKSPRARASACHSRKCLQGAHDVCCRPSRVYSTIPWPHNRSRAISLSNHKPNKLSMARCRRFALCVAAESLLGQCGRMTYPEAGTEWARVRVELMCARHRRRRPWEGLPECVW
jgi:hypothetical protein